GVTLYLRLQGSFVNLYEPVASVKPALWLESSSVRFTAATGSPPCLITRTLIEQVLASLLLGDFAGSAPLLGCDFSCGFPQLPSLFGGLPPGHCALAISGDTETSAIDSNRNNLLRRREKIILLSLLRNENLTRHTRSFSDSIWMAHIPCGTQPSSLALDRNMLHHESLCKVHCIPTAGSGPPHKP